MRRQWLWALALIVTGLALSGALVYSLGWRPSPQPPGAIGGSDDSVSRSITVEQGGRVTLLGGAALIVSPRALAGDGTVTLTLVRDDAPSLVKYEVGRPAGPAVRAEASGAPIAGSVTLELPYDPAALPVDTPEDTVFAAYYDESKGQWIPVGGKVDQQRKVVVVTTDHLSLRRPFTWNWDAWIAVLTKVLSLEVKQWLEAGQLLTEECLFVAPFVTVDSAFGNDVVKGCIRNGEDPGLALRVVNLKSFDIGLSAAGANDVVAAPGTSVSFTANASDASPYVVRASFSDEAMHRFVLRPVFKMLPNLGGLSSQVMQDAAQDMGAPPSPARHSDLNTTELSRDC